VGTLGAAGNVPLDRFLAILSDIICVSAFA